MALVNNLEAMLAAGTDNPLLRYGLGNEYLKAGDLPRAIAHLEKAVALDPQYSAAWKALAAAYVEAGDLSAARERYTRGIAVAEARGDIQAAKEMRVFLKRIARENPPQ